MLIASGPLPPPPPGPPPSTHQPCPIPPPPSTRIPPPPAPALSKGVRPARLGAVVHGQGRPHAAQHHLPGAERPALRPAHRPGAHESRVQLVINAIIAIICSNSSSQARGIGPAAGAAAHRPKHSNRSVLASVMQGNALSPPFGRLGRPAHPASAWRRWPGGGGVARDRPVWHDAPSPRPVCAKACHVHRVPPAAHGVRAVVPAAAVDAPGK